MEEGWHLVPKVAQWFWAGSNKDKFSSFLAVSGRLGQIKFIGTSGWPALIISRMRCLDGCCCYKICTQMLASLWKQQVKSLACIHAPAYLEPCSLDPWLWTVTLDYVVWFVFGPWPRITICDLALTFWYWLCILWTSDIGLAYQILLLKPLGTWHKGPYDLSLPQSHKRGRR